MKHKFISILEKSENKLWGAHLRVPDEIAHALLAQGSNRVRCILNDIEEFQCGIVPAAKGVKVITINKSIRTKLKLGEGDELRVQLEPDESEYGLPITEELAAAFEVDEEGKKYFHALTPGKQRTLLYIAAQVKNPDVRALRAWAILEHLKQQKGSIDYKLLHADIARRSKRG